MRRAGVRAGSSFPRSRMSFWSASSPSPVDWKTSALAVPAAHLVLALRHPAYGLDLGDPRVDHPVVFAAFHLGTRFRRSRDETDHDAGGDDGLQPRRHLLGHV